MTTRLDGYSAGRAVSPGAEEWLGKPIEVLDHGFIYLVDYMGTDESIDQAARVSYGKGTRKVSATRGLLRYLMRHRHTSPFEMVELKFHVKMPIFVARQWVRHRTASINEYSGRYSEMPREFYIPDAEDMNPQSTTNNQGRSEGVVEGAESLRTSLNLRADEAFGYYEQLLAAGVSREIARSVLPVSNYTEMYWKINLHNLLHFLGLRADSHAQKEIRVYAEAIEKIVQDGWPLTYEAYRDYRRDGMVLSSEEAALVRESLDDYVKERVYSSALSKREIDEFTNKLGL